jgi:hypothetical protein
MCLNRWLSSAAWVLCLTFFLPATSSAQTTTSTAAASGGLAMISI